MAKPRICPVVRSRKETSIGQFSSSRLADHIVVVPVAGARRPDPGPGALGWVVGPRPPLRAVESLLGLPHLRLVDLVVAAPEHAALVLLLPLLLDHPRVRVEIVRLGGPGAAGLAKARDHRALKAGVTWRERISKTGSVRTTGQHQGQRDYRGPFCIESAPRTVRTGIAAISDKHRQLRLYGVDCSSMAGGKPLRRRGQAHRRDLQDADEPGRRLAASELSHNGTAPTANAR